MAASMKKWISAKSSYFLLNLLSKKSVVGSKVIYTLPLKYNVSSNITNFQERALVGRVSQFFSQTRKLGLCLQTSTSRSALHQGDRDAKSSENKRYMSNGPDGRKKRPLMLMEFPNRIWPAPLKSMKNLFISLLIRGYIDTSFSPGTFLKGAEQAVGHVSKMVSIGDFDAMEGLVAREAIQEVRQNYRSLSSDQKTFVEVNTKDLFMKFIYEIGMIFDDETEQRYVEITTVLQGIHGLGDTQEQLQSFQEGMEHSQEQVFVCNYRFIREYTKGTEDDWTINKLNHFKPKDIVDETKWFDR